ncbi:MAG: hypothetical protein AAF563_14710 [Pseudomonadota bacterium]
MTDVPSQQEDRQSLLPWPDNYRDLEPVLRHEWGVEGEIYLNRQLSGKSGALVFAADLTGKDFAGQAILKLDRTSGTDWSQDREFERHRRAFEVNPDYAAAHLPRIVHAVQSGDEVAILSTIAGRGLEYALPWAECAWMPQLNVAGRLADDLLECWNEKSFLDPAMLKPRDLLQSWLGYRLDPSDGGRIHDFISSTCGLDPLTPALSFEGEWRPNPLAFAEEVVDIGPSTLLRAIRGNVHGDLHGFNVLVHRQAEVKPEYYLIDLDLYRDDGFLFFDHAYFELTYLLGERQSIEPSRWKSILNALSPRAHMQEDDVVTGDDVGMLQLVADMRDKVKTWVDRHEPNRLSYMESQCLMGRIAAGLALTHQTRSNAVRAMAFLYAASSLQDFLTLHDIDWPKNGPAFSYDQAGAVASPAAAPVVSTTKTYAAPSPASSAASAAIDSAHPSKPAIAVLAFENHSDDPDQTYFAEGIAGEIIADLSRMDWLMVIARSTSFVYRGQNPDPRQVGRELDVQYVVEGSVRKDGQKLDITVHLIEAATATELWANRYTMDMDVEDVIAAEEDIAATIVATIGLEVNESESKRALRKPPENLDAWDLYLRASWYFYQLNEEGSRKAYELSLRAIEKAPNYAPPYAQIALIEARAVFWLQTDDLEGSLKRGHEAATKAVSLDPGSSAAHYALSRTYTLRGKRDRAIAEAEASIALNPNSQRAHYFLALALIWDAQLTEAIPHIDISIDLSPKGPLLPIKLATKAAVLAFLDRGKEAEATAREALSHGENLPGLHIVLALILAHQDRIDEANAEAKIVIDMRPEVTIERMSTIGRVMDPDLWSHAREVLSRAGFSES